MGEGTAGLSPFLPNGPCCAQHYIEIAAHMHRIAVHFARSDNVPAHSCHCCSPDNGFIVHSIVDCGLVLNPAAQHSTT